ncbi:uncharacterized protein ACB058_000819 [Synchiropus picturatus]
MAVEAGHPHSSPSHSPSTPVTPYLSCTTLTPFFALHPLTPSPPTLATTVTTYLSCTTLTLFFPLHLLTPPKLLSPPTYPALPSLSSFLFTFSLHTRLPHNSCHPQTYSALPSLTSFLRSRSPSPSPVTSDNLTLYLSSSQSHSPSPSLATPVTPYLFCTTLTCFFSPITLSFTSSFHYPQTPSPPHHSLLSSVRTPTPPQLLLLTSLVSSTTSPPPVPSDTSVFTSSCLHPIFFSSPCSSCLPDLADLTPSFIHRPTLTPSSPPPVAPLPIQRYPHSLSLLTLSFLYHHCTSTAPPVAPYLSCATLTFFSCFPHLHPPYLLLTRSCFPPTLPPPPPSALMTHSHI